MSQPTITQIIDDRNPAVEFFSSAATWNQETNPLEFNQTATWTETAQDTILISFNGISIGVFGTLDSSQFPAVQTSYELDDPNIPVSQITNTSLIDGTQFQQQFYQSPILPPGSHTLTITNLANGSIFQFDFAKVVSPNPNFHSDAVPPKISTNLATSSTDSAIISSASSTDSSTVPAQTFVISPSSTDSTDTLPSSTSSLTGDADSTPSDASSVDSGVSPTGGSGASTSAGTSNGTHLAAILGGIIGGIALIVWVVVVFIIQRRRRRRNNRTRRMSEFLRRNSEKRPQQPFSPVRRHDSQDMTQSSFGTPESNMYRDTTDPETASRSSADVRPPPASTYELTPFTGQQARPGSSSTEERSIWSPEPLQPPLISSGEKRGFYYRDSPPKYNSGQFYHLDS